ncbi:MAG: hypothetical protein EXR79_03305 [Myxococcales bacterium]|nr:hypothetical protein [Myxococcales bacterium]
MNVRTLAVLVCVSSALVGGAACTSSTLQLARTTSRGETATAMAAGVQLFSVSGKRQRVPQFEVGGRYGLTDKIDVGARVWLPYWELDVKVQLARSATPTEGWDVAVAPGVGYLGGIPGDREGSGAYLHTAALSTTLYVGKNFASGSQLIVAPRAVDFVMAGYAEAAGAINLLYAGGSIGYAWKVSKTVRLVPQVSALFNVVGSLADFGTVVGLGGMHGQASLGVMFGGE